MTYTKVSDMSGFPFKGYFKDEDLPIQKGMKVRIPAGTTLRSYAPSKKGAWQATRAMTRKVGHVITGRSRLVAYVDRTPDEGEKWHWCITGSDAYDLCEALGIEGTQEVQDDAIKAIAELRPINDKPECHVFDAWVRVDSPTVRWPGTGGYWVWADINDVEIVEG